MDVWSDAQLVSLEGQAVRAFLQGYLTCNSDRIEKITPTPMTLCNLKGVGLSPTVGPWVTTLGSC